MSSGTVPLGTYHRANALGAGAYGSVVTVYDENGNELYTHEIADRCISEMLESVWMLSPLSAEESLSASNPVITLS